VCVCVCVCVCECLCVCIYAYIYIYVVSSGPERPTHSCAHTQQARKLRSELCAAEAALARLVTTVGCLCLAFYPSLLFSTRSKHARVRARAAPPMPPPPANIAHEKKRGRILKHMVAGLAAAVGDWHTDPILAATVLACGSDTMPPRPQP
jgi:hypothetical protein